jgi:DNA helicase-2/ATP-dependent DNA helicase PcrA
LRKQHLILSPTWKELNYSKSSLIHFQKITQLKRYRGDVYFEINNLQQLFSAMKREGWTPAYINEKIDEYIA